MRERFDSTHIVALPDALDRIEMDALDLGDGVIPMRFAPDELVLLNHTGPIDVDDSHAIVVPDGSWRGEWLDADTAALFLRAECAWSIPERRPAFAQGLVAGLPVKLWFDQQRTLIVIAHVRADDFAARLAPYLEAAR